MVDDVDEDGLCKLTGLEPVMCACRVHKPEPIMITEETIMTTTAKYYGKCNECDEDICVGDKIISNHGGWKHWDCDHV